jgi:hypothetical protein
MSFLHREFSLKIHGSSGKSFLVLAIPLRYICSETPSPSSEKGAGTSHEAKKTKLEKEIELLQEGMGILRCDEDRVGRIQMSEEGLFVESGLILPSQASNRETLPVTVNVQCRVRKWAVLGGLNGQKYSSNIYHGPSAPSLYSRVM